VWKASVDISEGDCHIGVDTDAGHYNQGTDYGLPPHTFMQRSDGVAKKFGAAMPLSATTALVNWKVCYGEDQSKWPFNTKCCATAGTRAGTSGDHVCVAPTAAVVV